MTQALKSALSKLPKETLVNAMANYRDGVAASQLLRQDSLEKDLLPLLIEREIDPESETHALAELYKTVLKNKNSAPEALAALYDYSNSFSYVSENPNTDANTLYRSMVFFDISGSFHSVQHDVAEHPNINEACGQFILDNLTQLSNAIALAGNAKAPVSILARIINNIDKLTELEPKEPRYGYNRSHHHRQPKMSDLFKALSSNPALSNELVEQAIIQLDPEWYPELTANPATSFEQACNIIQRLIDDDDSDARIKNKCIEALESRITEEAKNDPYHFNALVTKDKALFTLVDMGYDLSEIIFTKKLKKAVRSLIGSAHKEEIRLFERSKGLCVDAFSALQGAFTNKDGKLDRYSYVQLLTQINDAEVDGAALSMPAPSLKDAIDTIGLNGVLDTLKEQDSDGARDSLTMISNIVNSEYEEERTYQQKLIRRWVDKNDDRYDSIFHDYLSNKERRDNHRTPNAHFYQAFLATFTASIDDELKARWHDKSLSLMLPTNTAELRRLGSSQRHCVGGEYYAQRCIVGSDIIFALKVEGAMKHGYTFQFDRYSHQLLQAEGFCRAAPSEEMKAIAKQCFDALINGGQWQSSQAA